MSEPTTAASTPTRARTEPGGGHLGRAAGGSRAGQWQAPTPPDNPATEPTAASSAVGGWASSAAGVVPLAPDGTTGTDPGQAMVPGSAWEVASRPRSRAERLAFLFYVAAAVGAVIGQVWVAVVHIPWSPEWPMWSRVAVVVPFAICLELLGMVTAALADERMRLGERALGLRAFSAAVATTAVTIIVLGHWPDAYLVAGFGAFSAAAYLLWTLHAAARRRDALRARGLLGRVAPTYGLYRWLPLLGRPGWRVTHRARELAREHGLDLYESLRIAEQQLRVQARRPAIAAAVRSAVRAEHADPLMADIAVRTLDHDRIADELERRGDYVGWADRLAGVVSAYRPPATPGRAQPGPDTPPDNDQPPTGQRPDNGHAEWPDTPPAEPDHPDRRPDSAPRQRRASRPDTHPMRGRTTAGRNGQATAQQIAQAMTRTPRPTQVEVARELGVSERTVRRALRAGHSHGT